MTSVLVEAVRELAVGLGVEFRQEADDTDISVGKVFVDGKLMQATAPCWYVYLGSDRVPFKDCTAALIYLKALGMKL